MAASQDQNSAGAAQGGSPADFDPDLSHATPQMLQEAERELSELLGRKKAVDKQLMDLERKIYLLEGTYLEDTSQYGNIIKGFEGYLHTSSTKKKQKLSEEDRLFSRSSVTYPKALEMNQRSRDEMDDIADPEPSSATYASTPIAAPSSSSRSDRTKKSTLKKRKSSVVGEMDSPTPTQRRKKIKIPDGDD